MSIHIRKGTAADVTSILGLIKELAIYEKAGDEVTNTEEQMLKDGFGEDPIFDIIVAENIESKKIVGIALYYTAYSTWKGRMIYLDDLVVSKDLRKQGIGGKLLKELCRISISENAHLLKWQVLDWNEDAINFYEKFGVSFDEEWINCTINKKQMLNFAD